MQGKFVSLTSKERHQVGCETAHSHGFRYCKCIFFIQPIIHLIQWIDYGQLVRAFIFEQGACQSPSKQNLCVPSSTLVICIWCLYRQGAWIIFIIPGHLSYIEIWNHLIFWLIRTGLWRYNPLYLFSTFFFILLLASSQFIRLKSGGRLWYFTSQARNFSDNKNWERNSKFQQS